MPLYQYRCIDPECREVSDYRRPMAYCSEPATCRCCGKAARRIITPPLRAGVPVTMTPEQVRRSEEVWG